MIQKIIKNIKDFFKNPKEVISFFLPIVIMLILLIPVDYTVTFPTGGTINIDKKISVLNERKKDGSFNSAYVKQAKGNVLTYTLGKIIKDIDLEKNEEIVYDNETINDYQLRSEFTSKILLNDLMDIVLIRLDKTPEKEYTKRKQRLNQWCRFIVANSYEK